MRRLVFVLGLGAVLLAAERRANAVEWTLDKYPGVDYATFEAYDSKVYAARIHLCYPGIRMRATGPGEGPRTVQSFGELVGGVLAINGDWWARDGGPPDVPQTTYPRGLGVGNGKHFTGTYDTTSFGVVGFGKDFAFHSVMEDDIGGPNFFQQDVVSGQPTLVWGGQLRDNPTNHCGIRRARTATGFSADMTEMFVVVVQEVGGSAGVTCNMMGAIMQSVGADSALNQDGGGSSTMWLRGVGVVNGLTDGAPRSLVNHWSVLAPGEGPPNSCATRVVPPPETGIRRPVSPELMATWRFVNDDVRLIATERLEAYPLGPAPPAITRLIRGSGPEVYLVDEPFKRHVPSPSALRAWRLSGVPIEVVGDDVLDGLATGPALAPTPSIVLDGTYSVHVLDYALPSLPPPPGGDAGIEGEPRSGGCASAGGNGAIVPVGVALFGVLRRRRRRARRLLALALALAATGCDDSSSGTIIDASDLDAAIADDAAHVPDAGVTMHAFHPRGDWQSASQPIDGPPMDLLALRYITIHYNGDTQDLDGADNVYQDADYAALLRGMQSSYVSSRGYSLGYNSGIAPDGDEWEIRGIAFRNAANGCQAVNVPAYAIQITVPNPGASPTPQQIEGARQAIARVRAAATAAGNLNTLSLNGHRDMRPMCGNGGTSCPGDAIYQLLQDGQLEP